MTKLKEAPVKGVYFSLPKERILVRYVKKQTGFVVNPNHVAYGGKLEGATDILPARMSQSGKYVEVLTKEEQAGLEAIMVVEPGYLSIHKAKDNYWDSMRVTLDKEGVYLDLSEPYDFIRYKVLLSYDEYVSPSIMDTRWKKTYKYEVVRPKDIDRLDKVEVDYNIKAYKLFGKIEDSKEQMAGVIRVLSKRSVAATDSDWLMKEVGKLIDKDAKAFVEVLTDPDYELKLFLERGISKKQVKNTKGKYTTKDGIDLCEEGEIPTLTNAISFLKNIKNQEIKLAIEAGY